MREKAPPSITARPMSEVVDHLLKAERVAEEGPRSYAIEYPKNMLEFADALRRTAKLQYEYILSYDAKRDQLVLTTGDKYRAVHDTMIPELTKAQKAAGKKRRTEPEDLMLEERLSIGSNILHNHPTIAGLVAALPSPGDLLSLSTFYYQDFISRFSYIVCEEGIVRFGYPRHVPTRGQHLEKLLHGRLEEIKNELGLTTLNPSEVDLTAEVFEKFMTMSKMYMAEFDVEVELIPWTEKEKAAGALWEYLQSSTPHAQHERIIKD